MDGACVLKLVPFVVLGWLCSTTLPLPLQYRPANMPDFGAVERSGKLAVTREVLRLWKAQGHRALVFSQTRQMLDIIEDMIKGGLACGVVLCVSSFFIFVVRLPTVFRLFLFVVCWMMLNFSCPSTK